MKNKKKLADDFLKTLSEFVNNRIDDKISNPGDSWIDMDSFKIEEDFKKILYEILEVEVDEDYYEDYYND